MPTPDRPASLDDAQATLLEILAIVEIDSTPLAGYKVDSVYDGGQGRHERLVSFSLTTLAGVTTAFTATIRLDEE